MAESLLIRGGTPWTVTGGVMENCDVLIDGGRIVTPGLIDCHSHLGLWQEDYPLDEASGNEKTDPLTPHLRALDGFEPEDNFFLDARFSGITAVQILPGSANVMGGQGVVVKTCVASADEMSRRHPSGMKAAFGENPESIHKESKATLRSVLGEGVNYGKNRERDLDYHRDLRMEGVLSVLNNEMVYRG